MNPTRFASKIDAWLIFVVAISLAAPVVIVLMPHSANPPNRGATIGIAAFVLLFVGGIIWWIFSTTDYVISDTDLIVRSGPVRWQVPLDQLHTVRATRTILSAPALSLDRLEIKYGTYGSVIVSPADRTGFVKRLRERVPSLIVESGTIQE